MGLGEFIAIGFRSGIAPYDRIVVRLAFLIPADYCLSLIGDSNPFDIFDSEVRYYFFGFGKYVADGGLHILNDFDGVMLK